MWRQKEGDALKITPRKSIFGQGLGRERGGLTLYGQPWGIWPGEGEKESLPTSFF